MKRLWYAIKPAVMILLLLLAGLLLNGLLLAIAFHTPAWIFFPALGVVIICVAAYPYVSDRWHDYKGGE